MDEFIDKLESQRKAGSVASEIFQKLNLLIKPGINVLEIEKIASQSISEVSMKPAFLGYNGYPSTCCISVNDEIVHSIPRRRILKDGDIVTVDLGIENQGWVVDAARTFPVGKISNEIQRLINTAQKALDSAIEVCRPNNQISIIGRTIENIVTSSGFFIIRDLTGHGVGRALQETPSIPNFYDPKQNDLLSVGQSIAIEPIVSLKKCRMDLMPDGWTIVSSNGTPCVQVEDTIFISEDGPAVLTR